MNVNINYKLLFKFVSIYLDRFYIYRLRETGATIRQCAQWLHITLVCGIVFSAYSLLFICYLNVHHFMRYLYLHSASIWDKQFVDGSLVCVCVLYSSALNLLLLLCVLRCVCVCALLSCYQNFQNGIHNQHRNEE